MRAGTRNKIFFYMAQLRLKKLSNIWPSVHTVLGATVAPLRFLWDYPSAFLIY